MSQIVQPAWEDPLYCYGLCVIIPVSGSEQAPGNPRAGPSANVEKAACSEPCATGACIIFILNSAASSGVHHSMSYYTRFLLILTFILSMSSFWQAMLP